MHSNSGTLSDEGDGDPLPIAEVPEYSVHLDAIRGAAASVVFLSHIRLFFLSKTAASPADTIQTSTSDATVHRVHHNPDYAHHAVMVFFVLSGFLVGGSVVRAIRQRRWSWKRYLTHRIVRLWMVLIPALLLVSLLDRTGLHIFAGQQTLYSAPANQQIIYPNLESRLGATTFVGNLFFLQEILVRPLGTDQPLWSLTNEFWYYLAFPLIALVVFRRPAQLKTLLMLCLLVAMSWFVGAKISEYFVIWLMGVFAAVLPWRFSPKLRWPLMMIAIAGFMAIDLVIRIHGLEAFQGDLLIGLSAFLLLYGVAQLQRPFPAGPYRTGSRFMSRISYSLYLTHGPILCFMSALLVGAWRILPLNGHTVLIVGAVITTAFAVACAVHFLFENRTNMVRDYIETRLFPPILPERIAETRGANNEALSNSVIAE
jgi:peptidoglycan/LPS O-acetylase OafA/YrhL